MLRLSVESVAPVGPAAHRGVGLLSEAAGGPISVLPPRILSLSLPESRFTSLHAACRLAPPHGIGWQITAPEMKMSFFRIIQNLKKGFSKPYDWVSNCHYFRVYFMWVSSVSTWKSSRNTWVQLPAVADALLSRPHVWQRRQQAGRRANTWLSVCSCVLSLTLQCPLWPHTKSFPRGTCCSASSLHFPHFCLVHWHSVFR